MSFCRGRVGKYLKTSLKFWVRVDLVFSDGWLAACFKVGREEIFMSPAKSIRFGFSKSAGRGLVQAKPTAVGLALLISLSAYSPINDL